MLNSVKLFRSLFILFVVCCVAASVPAFAEDPDATYITLENGYLGVAIGTGGHWHVDPPGHFFDDDQPAAGRFDIWCTGGDPTTVDDDGFPLLFGYYGPPGPGDKWGAWMLMVDTWTTDSEHIWASFEMGGTAGIMGDDTDGVFTLSPYIPTNQNIITAVWYPTPEEAATPQGEEVTLGDRGYIPIKCELEVRLMRDTVRFKWAIKNEDSVEHLIGLRVCADVMPSPLDGGTASLDNVISVPGYPLITDRTVISGGDVPDMIEMFNSQESPVLSIRNIFRGQGATTPDKVGIDDWWDVASSAWTYGSSSLWLYEPTPYQYIDDVGYGAFWKPQRLPAGRTATFIHYMGLACSTSDFTRPNLARPQYVAGVQGPRALKYYTDSMGLGVLDPDPFTVTAYLEDQEKFMDLQDASFTLTLPAGLALDDSEGGAYTKALSTISAASEGSVSWQVKLTDPYASPAGIVNYSVSFSAAPVGGTTVTRAINIPATEWQPLSRRWQMISVPFSLTNSDPEAALGLPPGGYTVWRYDSYERAYEAATALTPGEAYWLWLDAAQTTDMTAGEYSPIAWTGTQGYQIDLQSGWNLVGNPYVYAVTLGETRFYHRDYGVVDYDEAVARRLISRTLFWWDPVFQRYRWSSQRSAQLKPWQGCWVRALKSGVTLIITPVSQIGASLGGTP